MSAPPPRLVAALADRYRIVRELGAGGMATVYLADDLKHGREVALKVLRPELAAVIGGERFLSEIRTTARLQHPHILPLFDSGEADAFLYYVMPFVKGETLRDKLDRERQLGVDEAVAIASAVARALDYAHREGVLHRDIKPANILLHDGQPVVADFGVALALGAAGGTRLTETGLSVGTPYYMSPEQATGDQAIGPPADIFALGAVLHEMLVGEPPFTGSTAQAILGKIIRADPVSVMEQRRAVPVHVDAVVRCALERVPADRFSTAKAFASALADPAFRHRGDGAAAGTAATTPSIWNRWGPVAAGVAVLAIAIAIAGWSTTRSAPDPGLEMHRLELPGEENDVLIVSLMGRTFDVAPGGEHLAFAAPATGDPAGMPRLWVKRATEPEWHVVSSPVPAVSPRFSPDGERIAVLGEDGIHIVTPDGRELQTIGVSAEVEWLDDETLVGVDVDYPSRLQRIDLRSGTSEEWVDLSPWTLSAPPAVLPSGEALVLPVCEICPTETTLMLLRPDEGELHPLGRGLRPHGIPGDVVVFARPDGSLWAGTVDVANREFQAGPIQIGPAVATTIASAGVSVAPDGTMLLLTGPTRRADMTLATYQPTWIDRAGVATPVDPDWADQLAYNFGHALSPSGDRLAIGLRRNDAEDIWVKQLPEGPLTRVTDGETRYSRPQWRPGGDEIWFQREDSSGTWVAHRRRADGTGAMVPFPTPGYTVQEVMESPDGAWLIARVGGLASRSNTGRDVVAYPAQADGPMLPIGVTEHDEYSPRLSPDGRWLAYVSTEAGRPEVFVRSFPDFERGRTQVSIDGGILPLWRGDSSELYYLSEGEAGGTVMRAAQVETDGEFAVRGRTTLFAADDVLIGPGWEPTIDVTADGERFLVMIEVEEDDLDIPFGLVLVQGALADIQARLDAAGGN